MRSLPAAMTWELFALGRWTLPAAALGALVFPIVLLTALEHDGALDPRDQSMFMMHFVLVQMNIVTFGSALIAGQWNLSRLYPYPATSARLVAWRLLPAMLTMAVEAVVWTAVLNAMFRLNWPLWGPALLSAVVVAAVEAAFWLAGKSRWIVFALTVVGAALGLWFKSRYGGMFSDYVHVWDAVTSTEIFTLLGIAALAFWMAVVGVARDRRGEPPFTVGLVAWLDRAIDRSPSTRRFGSPKGAHFWYAWRNGWLMPSAVGGGLLVGLVVWLFAIRDAGDLVLGAFVANRFLLCIAVIGGAVLGNVGSSRDPVMSQFLATRPMTTADMARTALRAGALSLLAAWGVWAAALAIVYGAVAAFGVVPSPLLPRGVDWRELPASFLTSWIILGSVASISLAGHPRLFVRLFAGLFASYIGFALFAKYAMSSEANAQLMTAVVAAISLIVALATIGAFAAARRRGLIDTSTACAAFAVWAALVVGGVMLFPLNDAVPRTTYALVCGLLALAVAPVAAAPLALAWNRHR